MFTFIGRTVRTAQDLLKELGTNVVKGLQSVPIEVAEGYSKSFLATTVYPKTPPTPVVKPRGRPKKTSAK